LRQIINSVMLLKGIFFSCDFNVISMCILSMHYSKASDHDHQGLVAHTQGNVNFRILADTLKRITPCLHAYEGPAVSLASPTIHLSPSPFSTPSSSSCLCVHCVEYGAGALGE
jgi:hypothetical protein